MVRFLAALLVLGHVAAAFNLNRPAGTPKTARSVSAIDTDALLRIPVPEVAVEEQQEIGSVTFIPTLVTPKQEQYFVKASDPFADFRKATWGLLGFQSVVGLAMDATVNAGNESAWNPVINLAVALAMGFAMVFENKFAKFHETKTEQELSNPALKGGSPFWLITSSKKTSLLG